MSKKIEPLKTAYMSFWLLGSFTGNRKVCAIMAGYKLEIILNLFL